MMTRRPESVFLQDSKDVARRSFSKFHVRHFRPTVIGEIYDKQPEVTLRRGVDLLRRRNQFGIAALPWWIGVGTALGFARERDFIQWDTDIDVRILLEYGDRAAAQGYAAKIVDLFQNNGFALIREVYWDHHPVQVAFADQDNNDLIFDIYFFYQNPHEDFIFHYIVDSYREKPRHFIDNLESSPWPTAPDIMVNVPSPIEDYLAWRFGPNWGVSHKKSDIAPDPGVSCLQPIPKITVLTYGTWDGLHFGHERLLQRAKDYGDRLVVGVVSDALCTVKGKSPLLNETQRSEALRDLDYVDAVFVQRELDQKEKDISRLSADYLVVGDDWKHHPRFEQVRGYKGIELIYLERTPDISSTQLRRAQAARRVE